MVPGEHEKTLETDFSRAQSRKTLHHSKPEHKTIQSTPAARNPNAVPKGELPKPHSCHASVNDNRSIKNKPCQKQNRRTTQGSPVRSPEKEN